MKRKIKTKSALPVSLNAKDRLDLGIDFEPIADAQNRVGRGHKNDDLAVLIERNAQKLWRYVLSQVSGDENMAEEVMQEICLQTTRSRIPDGDNARTDAWIFGLSRNVLRRHWRTLSRRRKNIPGLQRDQAVQLANVFDNQPLPEEFMERRETLDYLVSVIETLGDEEREMIHRYYFLEESQQYIADAMGVSIRAVGGRLYRARQVMRDKLAHFADDFFEKDR
jgi:RNA polymerase sigma-70 factor, ECF subfamily